MSEELKQILLKAPDTQFDEKLKPYVQKWDDPPKAVQVLEVLDYVVNGGGASGLVVQVLQIELQRAIAEEGTTREAIVAQAIWRNQ